MSAPVPIRCAATLMPVRDAVDGAGGVEVCLLRRNAQSTWVAGLALFPGGAVDPEDDTADVAERCTLAPGTTPSALAGGLAPWVAALRECFEEIGLLLATGDDGQWGHDDPRRAARLSVARTAVSAGTQTLASVLRDEALMLRVDRMRFVAHWVTPPGQSRRYDTRFFVAPAPPGAPCAPDGTEIVAAQWVAPREAIAAHERGELPMLPPTLGALHWLAPHRSVTATLAAASALGDIPRFTPGHIADTSNAANPDTAAKANDTANPSNAPDTNRATDTANPSNPAETTGSPSDRAPSGSGVPVDGSLPSGGPAVAPGAW